MGSVEKNADGCVVRKLLRLDGEKVKTVAAALVGFGSLAHIPVSEAVRSETAEEGEDWFPLRAFGLSDVSWCWCPGL